MIFSEINAALTTAERIASLLKKIFSRKKIFPPISVAERFLQIFAVHGVHKNQIPRFFGHDIAIKDLENEKTLTEKLDERALDAVCELFAVRREWLDGASENPYVPHDFYGRPKDFIQFVEKLRCDSEMIGGYLVAPERIAENSEALLILEQSIGFVGSNQIYRYHLCNNWIYSYWKSRGYLAACVASAWREKFYVYGRYAEAGLIESVAEGQSWLVKDGEFIFSSGLPRWYAEDLALEPEVYLNSIDPERDNFGRISALKLWLQLEEEGLMDVGLQKNVRSLFQHELEKFVVKKHG